MVWSMLFKLFSYDELDILVVHSTSILDGKLEQELPFRREGLLPILCAVQFLGCISRHIPFIPNGSR